MVAQKARGTIFLQSVIDDGKGELISSDQIIAGQYLQGGWVRAVGNGWVTVARSLINPRYTDEV